MVAIPDDNLPSIHSSRAFDPAFTRSFVLTPFIEIAANGALLGGSHFDVVKSHLELLSSTYSDIYIY